MQTTRGLDRLVFFTDAVTAIAITLLILPLVDSVTEAANKGHSAGQFLADNEVQLLGLALSFAVIARLWVSHHSTFEHVAAYNAPLLMLNIVWAFTIVVLPLPTAISHVIAYRRLLYRHDGGQRPGTDGNGAADSPASGARGHR